MTIKALLFILFLYTALVWVGAFGLKSGPDITAFGLFWTAVGIAAVLAFVILSRLYGVWRVYRSRPKSRVVKEKPAAAQVHPEDALLSALFAEANASLTKVPGVPPKTDIRQLPLYILTGPEGSGKTSTFANSGLQPVLLAGRATDTRFPEATDYLNIWFAGGIIFADLSGRAFSAGSDTWMRMLGWLRGQAEPPSWRRIWKDDRIQTELRGVVGFCHAKELIGASADPQRLERCCRDWKDRLRSIGEVFGTTFPVYQVITNCDSIPYFPDYFRRLQDGEANQVLGCAIPPAAESPATSDADAKRITGLFRTLYRAVAQRRLVYIAHEPQMNARAAIYEFPRELKRIRAALVQFLTDAFGRGPSTEGPALRGFYLTGVCEAEPIREASPTRADWSVVDLDASRMFRGDATRMFRPDDPAPQVNQRSKGRRPQWLFASELFRKVVMATRPAPQPATPDRQLDKYRVVVLAAVTACCLLLCTAFSVSWAGNRSLLNDVESSTVPFTGAGEPVPTLTALRSLERMRSQLERLTRGPGYLLHMGLYSGNQLVDPLRSAYFSRFQRLLLNAINGGMVESLRASATNPDSGAAFDPLYRTLKAHLMITSGACAVDPPLAASVLKKENRALRSDAESAEWQALADRQIDYYAAELRRGNPCKLSQDSDACSRARQTLQRIRGVNGFYATIVSNAEQSLKKPVRLTDVAPGYQQVLSGPAEMSAAFTRAGWSFVEEASKGRSLTSVDSCAMGTAPVAGGDTNEIQRTYLRDYVDHWLKYLSAFSVVPYSNAQDAAIKLAILSDHNSPLLGLLAMTSNETDFKPSAGSTALEQVPYLGPLLKKGADAGKRATQIHAAPTVPSALDIARAFQPVQWVVPPGSDTWVVEKNAPYTEALAQLGHSMQDLGANKSVDAAAIQAANQNYDKALDTVHQIAKGFKPVDVDGIDGVVERLLEEPILRARKQIPGDPAAIMISKVNGEMHGVCQSIAGTLRKYPFQNGSLTDASPKEFGDIFAPGTGAIWKFESQSLAELVVKEGHEWKLKDPSKKPAPTPEILKLLNRAQAIADAFYPPGATSPQIRYSLRLPEDHNPAIVIELDVDGQKHEWTSPFQHSFTWPAAPGATAGAEGTVRAGLSAGFGSHDGVWGIFRVIGDAEPRPPSSKTIEWKFTHAKDGRPERLNPSVKLELVDTPGGIDVFNPLFFSGVRCSGNAVE